MKKLIAILFTSLLMSGAAYAEVGPNKSANCKDIIDGIKKKAAQPNQPAQPATGNPGNTGTAQ
jgi:hypothetical protein